MPSSSWLALPLYIALVLAIALYGLTASGHFPAAHRTAALRSRFGAGVLFASMAVTLAGFCAALYVAATAIPWYAAVIGGGLAVLFAPLVLARLPDRFVDAPAALAGFAGATVFFAALLFAAVAW